MSRSPKPVVVDLELWHSIARTAKPLRGRKPAPPAPVVAKPAPPAAAPASPPPPKASASQRQRSGPPPIDRRTADRLKRGIIPIDARLDLHGLTEAAAFDALGGFIRRSAAAERRHTLVITGKGRDEPDEPGPIPTRRRGVLRQAVPRWLAEPPLADLVLGVGPAGPGHGGNGALYVLLRRAKPRGAGR